MQDCKTTRADTSEEAAISKMFGKMSHQALGVGCRSEYPNHAA